MIISLSNKQEKDNNEKIVTTTKQVNLSDEKDEKVKEFDKTKIIIKVAQQDFFPETDAYDLYVYDKKVELGGYIVGIKNISIIEDIAIIEVALINDTDLIIVDTESNVLFTPYNYNKMRYCTNSVYTSECYWFKVTDNKISFYLDGLGQDPYDVCDTNYNNEVLNEYELIYENGKLSEPKKLSSIFGKEYAKNNKIKCSNVK